MPNLNSRTSNSYASSVQTLATVRVEDLHRQHLLTVGLKGLQLVAAGVLVGCAVLLANRYIRPLGSAAPSSPAVIEAPVSLPTIASAEPESEEEPETTAKTVVAAVPGSDQLQAILDKWRTDYSIGTVGVYIKELGENKRTASLNASQKMEAASLYKMFMADYLYNNIDRGKLSFDTTLSGMSQTIGNCLKPMIVNSDNACGEGFGYSIGWPTLHNYVRAQGFNQTIMSPVNQTTASDTAKYLDLLYNGKLIKNSSYTNQLLGYMKVQIYRYGIPAGVPGQTVADKVGSNPGIYHDAAIVYGPKSTYILSVMSKNSSAAAIKDLSGRVAKFFSQ